MLKGGVEEDINSNSNLGNRVRLIIRPWRIETNLELEGVVLDRRERLKEWEIILVMLRTDFFRWSASTVEE